MPDFNVYTQSVNPKPEKFEDNTRTTGLHIHLGYEKPSIDFSLSLVKYMDMYVGVPSVLTDTNTKRRKYYGNAGSFRLCEYGVEYRCLSGLWLKDAESLKFIHKQTVKAVNACLEGKELADAEMVISTINNLDSKVAIKQAKELVKRYNLI